MDPVHPYSLRSQQHMIESGSVPEALLLDYLKSVKAAGFVLTKAGVEKLGMVENAGEKPVQHLAEQFGERNEEENLGHGSNAEVGDLGAKSGASLITAARKMTKNVILLAAVIN